MLPVPPTRESGLSTNSSAAPSSSSAFASGAAACAAALFRESTLSSNASGAPAVPAASTAAKAKRDVVRYHVFRFIAQSSACVPMSGVALSDRRTANGRGGFPSRLHDAGPGGLVLSACDQVGRAHV